MLPAAPTNRFVGAATVPTAPTNHFSAKKIKFTIHVVQDPLHEVGRVLVLHKSNGTWAKLDNKVSDCGHTMPGSFTLI